MVTKKAKLQELKEEKFQEAELQETPNVNAQPVPATEEEVQQAVAEVQQPELAQPAVADDAAADDSVVEVVEDDVEESAESAEEAVADPMFTPPAEGYVPAGWVKIEDLAAAVAQATGDVVPAETAPDVQVSNEEEAIASVPSSAIEEEEEGPLVEEPITEVAEKEQTITESVEASADDSAEEAVKEDESNDVVSGDLPDQDKITEAEDVCPACGKEPCECEEELDFIEESKKDNEICFGTALAKKKNELNKMTNNKALADFVEKICRPLANDKEQEDYLNNMIKTINKENFAKALMYVYNIILKGEGFGVIKEAEEEDPDLGKSMEEVIGSHFEEAVEDEDASESPVDSKDDSISENDVESNVEVDEVEVFDDENEDEDEDEEVDSKTLDAVDAFIEEDSDIDEENIDFISNLSNFLDGFEDEATNAKAESDEILSSISDAADTLEDSSNFLKSLLDDEEDYGVDISYLNFSDEDDEEDNKEDEVFSDNVFEDEVEEEELEEGIIDKLKVAGYEALGGDKALAREVEDYKNNPEKYAHNPLKGIVDALLVKRGFMDEDHNWIEEEDFDDDYEEDFDDNYEETFEESTAKGSQKDSKIQEKIIYPAGSEPSEETENLYATYIESSAARRRAIAKFRESMKRSNSRFNEALHTYTGSAEEKTVDSSSWEANKFVDKYTERKAFSYKELLENGFLG